MNVGSLHTAMLEIQVGGGSHTSVGPEDRTPTGVTREGPEGSRESIGGTSAIGFAAALSGAVTAEPAIAGPGGLDAAFGIVDHGAADAVPAPGTASTEDARTPAHDSRASNVIDALDVHGKPAPQNEGGNALADPLEPVEPVDGVDTTSLTRASDSASTRRTDHAPQPPGARTSDQRDSAAATEVSSPSAEAEPDARSFSQTDTSSPRPAMNATALNSSPLVTNEGATGSALIGSSGPPPATTTSLFTSNGAVSGTDPFGGPDSGMLDATASLEDLPRAMVRLVRGAGPLGERVAVVQLTPPELGRIRVRLGVAGDEVRASVETELASTRDALRDLLQPLTRSLADAGLSLERFDVTHRSRSDGDTRAFDARQGGDATLSGGHGTGNGAGQRDGAGPALREGQGYNPWLPLGSTGDSEPETHTPDSRWFTGAVKIGQAGLDIWA